MEYVEKAASLIFSEKCMDEYFEKFNFLDVDCFKATLSKCLGLGLIAGSIFVKIPQITKIYHAKSGEGISLFSVLLDVFGITAMTSYGFASKFPFSAYGDGVFLALQTITILIQVLHYEDKTGKATASFAAYTVVVFAVLSGVIPLSVLWAGQAATIPVVLLSKLTQAFKNYTNGSTGQLSAVTGFMLFFGSLARIFTSIQETNDPSMILLYICSTSANGVLVAQILYYWNVDKNAKKKDLKKKKVK